LNQLLDNFDDILKPGKNAKAKKEINGDGPAKKTAIPQ
jgi:hypothetical protein